MSNDSKEFIFILCAMVIIAVLIIFTTSIDHSYKYELKQCSYEYGTSCTMIAVPKGFAKEFR